MPTPVIFDLGGVLIDWNPRYLYRQLFDDASNMEHFLATVCTMDWNAQQDAGRSVKEATQNLITLWPDYADLIEAYYERWPEMIQGPIEETVAVLEELKQCGTPLFALTNWSAETFPYVEHRYPFMDWFQYILVSGREGMKKPNPRIFRLLLDRCQLSVEGTLFIDDNEENIQTATNIGLHAILFRSAASLRKELKQKGFL